MHSDFSLNKTEIKDTMGLGTAQFCFTGSRIEWVSALFYYHIIGHHVNSRLIRQEKMIVRITVCIYDVVMLYT